MTEPRHLSPPTEPVGAARSGSGSGSDSGIDVAIEEAEVETEKKPLAVKAPEPPPSQRAPLGGGDGAKRARAKVTLKIPDDEISRPQLTPSAPPAKAADHPPVDIPLSPMKPMRIISIESAPPSVKPALAPPAPPTPTPSGSAPGGKPPPLSPEDSWSPSPAPAAAAPKAALPSSPDDSWTPYQPTAADRAISAQLPVVAPRVPRPEHPASLPPPPRPPHPSNVHATISPPAAPVVVPDAPPTAPSLTPPAPPTEPRSVSMDDILILTDDQPSSGEIEEDDDARPTSPIAFKVAESKAVPTPSIPPPFPPPPPPIPRGESSHHASAPSISPPAISPAAVTPPPPLAVPPVPPPPIVSPPAPVVAAPPLAGAPSIPAPAIAPTGPTAPIAPSPPRVAAIPSAPISQPQVNIKDLPPMRALAQTEPEGLEVHFEDEDDDDATPASEDDDESASATPRMSEPEAEIALEDLVSIESVPSPAKQLAVKAILQTETPARAFVPLGVSAAGVPVNGPPLPVASATGAARPLLAPVPVPAKPAGAPKVARVIVPTASPLAPPPMSEAAPSRRKARPWWEELFNDDFIRTMAKVTDDQIAKEVDFVEESLAVAKGAMLLDLGCGTGRHAIELTRRGYKVVGFDLSLPMLAKAAEEAQERSQKLNFVQGDMREMTFEDTFDGIYCWNTSFGFFEEEKNAQVIQRVHKALKKGGQFVLEVGNRDYIIRQAPSLAWFEGDGCICMDEMSIDWITSRMKVKRTMMMDDGRTKEIDYSVRIYSLHELGRILHESGFRVAEVSGRTGTPGVYFGSESPRTMILAEKK